MATSLVAFERPHVTFYGISLENSAVRSWTQNDGESTLKFNWDEIPAGKNEDIDDLYVTLGQHFPTDDRDQVKSLAHDIYESSHMRLNDSIFGVTEGRLERIGYISAKKAPEEKEILLSIKWVADVENGILKEPIISNNAQVQVIKPAKLKKIEKQFPAVIARAYESMPEMEDDFKSFESFRHIEDTGEDIKIKGPLIDETPKEDKGGLITLFYGTNRALVEKQNDMDQYGKEMDETVHYGTCVVQLPEGHREGELERPGKILFKFPLPENPHIHVVLKSVEQLEINAFNEDFVKKLTERPSQQALLFIHGYHTTFNEAAYRTAQLAWDLPFSGYAGFFSWPSSGKLMPYLADEAAARSSVPALKSFIVQLLKYKELEHLHIIAHSMGSLVLTLSLKDLASDPAFAGQLEKIYQLILGAADIDKTEFETTILPAFNKVGQRRTLYASDHDLALSGSSMGRSYRERLGQVAEDIFVTSGLDSVEASNLDTPSSHGYMFESKEVLSDIFYLLTQGLSPSDRRLREIKKHPVNYWLFPK
jgi:esterase/lipase superfamily enzyme